MLINGEKFHLSKDIILKDFLIDQGYDIDRVAVEKNGDIIPKANFTIDTICNEDSLEIVQFVGGG